MVDKTVSVEKLLHAEATQQSGQDEVDHVLTILRILKKQVSSPVVRECLEAARSDIAHLTGPVGAVCDEDEEDDGFDDQNDMDE